MYYGRFTNGVILNALLNTAARSRSTPPSFNSTASSSVRRGRFPHFRRALQLAWPSARLSSIWIRICRTRMVEEFDLAVQQQVGKGTVFSVSYLGALGKELTNFLDFNLNPNTEERSTLRFSDWDRH